MKTLRILTGQSFGKWRAKERVPDKNGRAHWLCKCECGATREVSHSNLIYGLSTSCGCSKRRHGHRLMGIASPTMKCYEAMVSRCTNPSSPSFKHYGQRGITVCPRWLNGEGNLNGFECFLADMGERPSLDHSIDRIDNDGNYELNNCRWATRLEQARNRSTTNLHFYKGENRTLREWGEAYNIPYEVLRHRVSRAGIPIGTAIELGNTKPYRLPR